MAEQELKNMTIKTNKSARDYRSYSGMSASQDGGRIPRKNKKMKLLETSITDNNITQDQDSISKEAKVFSSI